MKEIVTCYRCNGDGEIEIQFTSYQCPICKGNGMLDISVLSDSEKEVYYPNLNKDNYGS